MIVAGIGCRPGASDAALQAVLLAAFRGCKPTAVATLTSRRPLLIALADRLNLPLILIDPEQIAGIATSTRSPPSLAAYGTGSVAEAVALIAAGTPARLIVPRIISPDRQATCALAEGSLA